jgi:hypothetical protein
MSASHHIDRAWKVLAHEDLLAAFLSTKALDITPRPLPRPRHAITESVLTDILYGCDLPLPVLLALKTAERLLLKERGVTRKQLAEWALLQTQMYRDEHACAERYISERDTALKEAHTLREKAAKVAVDDRVMMTINNVEIRFPHSLHVASVLSSLNVLKIKLDTPASANSIREQAGRLVRDVWIQWAKEQPDCAEHPSWTVPYDQIAERDREVDRRIGETLIGYARIIAEQYGIAIGREYEPNQITAVLRAIARSPATVQITDYDRRALISAAHLIERKEQKSLIADALDEIKSPLHGWEGEAVNAAAQALRSPPMLRRGANAVDPDPQDIGRARFLAWENSEECVNCGKHVSKHCGKTRYFCAPRNDELENVIKLLLHNISKQEWQVAIENESVKSGYVASVINPALQDTQLYARRTEYVYGAENVHGWFCCNGIASRLETRGDTRIDAAQRMIAAILSGVFKFTNDK